MKLSLITVSPGKLNIYCPEFQKTRKFMDFPGGSVVKNNNNNNNLPSKQETQVQSLGREDPGRRKWQPTPVCLPGKSYGQKNLVVYSPWSLKRVGHDVATKQV